MVPFPKRNIGIDRNTGTFYCSNKLEREPKWSWLLWFYGMLAFDYISLKQNSCWQVLIARLEGGLLPQPWGCGLCHIINQKKKKQK